MMKKIALLILNFCFVISLSLGQEIKISLLTTTPGELPHTMFGHSALRVIDAENDFDKIYNFGLVDFAAPGFAMSFLRGELDYWMGRQTLQGFIDINNKEGRLIEEQVLNIDQETAQAIFDELKFLHKEENKFYRYSFTKKNCTTQIRDILVKHGVLREAPKGSISKRDQLEPYVQDAQWFRLGINLIMGMELDENPPKSQSVFLPADLKNELANTEGLVKAHNELNNVEPLVSDSRFKLNSPLTLFSVLLVLSLFIKKNWYKNSLYLLVGLMGVFVTYIALVTQHTELTSNLNILWCSPVYLLLLFIVKRKNIRKYVLWFLMISILAVLLIWCFQIQTFDYAILPILFMLLIFHRRELKAA